MVGTRRAGAALVLMLCAHVHGTDLSAGFVEEEILAGLVDPSTMAFAALRTSRLSSKDSQDSRARSGQP